MISEKYLEYAVGVYSGKITACKYVKQATKRYLDYIDDPRFEFREEEVEKVINFVSKLRHSTGSHNGKPFILLPYQVWIVASIFGFYYKGTSRRVVNYVYIELARKNGKSAFVAAILLYMLIASGENGAECELVANSAKQAGICFDMASNFLSTIDRKGKYFQRYRSSIKFEKRKALLQVLSSDASGNDGFNSSAFCLDEAHEQKDSKLWDVMVSSQGMRDNPLGLIITTAGFNKFGFCYSYRRTCLEILSGIKDNPSQFAAIYTLDPEDNWQDPDIWVKANPSLGVTVKKEYLEQQVLNAKNNSSLEVGIKTKNFNVWCDSQETWIPHDTLLQSTKNWDYTSTDLAFIGVDLAAVGDLTAVSVLVPRDSKFYFKTSYYLPNSALLDDNPNSELYKEWKRKGLLNITPGNVTDYDYITADLVKVANKVSISSIGYDSWNATSWATQATSVGLPLLPYSQSIGNFNRPTKEFERLIKSGKVVIEDNEITRYCFSNVALKFDHNENCKPVKGGSELQKIDGVIAMLTALGSYLESPLFNQEIYIL